MTDNSVLLDMVLEWTRRVGKVEVMKRLISRGLSFSTAEKMCNGRYKSVPKALISSVLINEMARDGISLADEAV